MARHVRPLTLDIHTTTGGAFALTAEATSTVDHLKKLVSKRLKVPKERICLLHRDRQLRDGTLESNGLVDGSRLVLLPSVETGLLTQRPENSVMQALESLNDSQVNDFLSGKSPLNLTMRLGDHMMLIQLQLSTFPGGGSETTSTKSKSRRSASVPPAEPEPAARPAAPPPEETPECVDEDEDFKSFLRKQDIETLQNAFDIFKSLAEIQKEPDDDAEADASPPPEETPPSEPSDSCTGDVVDPIAANLTSCLCSELDSGHAGSTETVQKPEADPKNVDCDETLPTMDPDDPLPLLAEIFEASYSADPSPTAAAASQKSKLLKNKSLHYLLHKSTKSGKSKSFIQSLMKRHMKKRSQVGPKRIDASQPSTSRANVVCESVDFEERFDSHDELPIVKHDRADPGNASCNSDSNSLVEASKNLTQTLKKLSKEVLTNKVDLANEETARPKIGQGAVIESMKHHGKGIYSGTFSGTLNPALQDRYGRPKRDISTIIHILNDLLCATPPQYRRGARITFEPTHTTSTTHSKQREPKLSVSSTEATHPLEDCNCSKCSGGATVNACPYGECNGHYTSPSSVADILFPPPESCCCKRPECADSAFPANKRDRSADRLLCDPDDPHTKAYISSISKLPAELIQPGRSPIPIQFKTCKKCNIAKTLASDNSKTKGKLDQLRLVMQQKKQRREARKTKTAPYQTGGSLGQPDPPVIAEEIETLA